MRSTLLRRRREGGAVSVEFVFILPILLLLIFGIIQFAYYLFQVQQGAFAVREAARQAAVGIKPCTGADGLIAFTIERVSTPSTVTVTLTAAEPDGTAIASGDNIDVGDTINANLSFTAADFGFPFIPFPNNAAVNQTADTRVENVTANTPGYLCSGTG